VLWAAYKIIWVPELWVASILLSMATGFMLSLLTLRRSSLWPRARTRTSSGAKRPTILKILKETTATTR